MASKFPESVGRFRVEALLGSGGMGEVYKAIDPTLRRTVAVKTVRPDITNPEYLDRLLREAQACASLQHPNIVTVYEAGEIDGAVYMVMEYLEGEDLAQVLNRGGLTFDERIRTIIQILDALEHAHAKGVVHRDIKPANIRLLPGGNVKLVDFGLARITKAETLTATGMVMGTPHYASPEQLRGESIDRRTDIYSTGTMAYEMCSGRRPFDSGNSNLTTVILKVVSEPPPPMDVPWSRNFPEVERIVNRAMAKLPDDRYQSAADMKNAFAAFLSSSREAINAAQVQDTIAAERIVVEARGLVAAGKKTEAQSLLGETLKVNLNAPDVRLLLDELKTIPLSQQRTSMTPPDEATAPVHAPAPAKTALDPVPAPRSQQTTPIAAPSPVAPAPPLPPLPSPPAAPSRTLWWVGGIAAVGGVILGIMTLPAMMDPASPETVAVNQTAGSDAAPSPSSLEATPVNPTASAPAPDVARAVETTPRVPAAPGNNSSSGPQPAASTAGGGVALTAGAKSLFYSEVKPAAAGKPATQGPTGLRYRLTQASTGANETDVDPATAVFRSGDRVRLAFESNIDGFLYVVQEGSSGRWTVLFPNPDINGGRNSIRRGEEYLVPPDGWFAFDNNPGTEHLFVVLSKEPLSDLPGFNKPVTTLERVNASVVESVQQTIRSRDLTFERDSRAQTQGGKSIQANYVVNRAELGKAVAVSLSLNHGQ